jgi:hypothetical protein
MEAVLEISAQSEQLSAVVVKGKGNFCAAEKLN